MESIKPGKYSVDVPISDTIGLSGGSFLTFFAMAIISFMS